LRNILEGRVNELLCELSPFCISKLHVQYNPELFPDCG
jgi:hypothetical protein